MGTLDRLKSAASYGFDRSIGRLIGSYDPAPKGFSRIGIQGRQILKADATNSATQYVWQLNQAKLAGARLGIMHPVVDLYRRTYGFGVPHVMQLEFFHILRRMLPVLNSAFEKRRALEGAVVFTSKDKGLQRELNEICKQIPVGYMSGGTTRGLNVYLDALLTASDEYGLGVGEIILDPGGRMIEKLIIPDMRSFALEKVLTRERRVPEYRLMQSTEEGLLPVNGPFVHRVGLATDGDDPWPHPLAFGLESISEILVRMFIAVNNLWQRVADAGQIFQIVYDKDAELPETVERPGPDGTMVDVDANLAVLYDELIKFNQAKHLGLAADIPMSLIGGKVEKEAIFDHPATNSLAPYLHQHYPFIEGQVIDKSQVPYTMFSSSTMKGDGMGSNRSQLLGDYATKAAMQRQGHKLRVAESVIDAWLLFDRAESFIGKYEVEFVAVSAMDEKLTAEADKTRAEAHAAWIQNALMLYPNTEAGEINEETGKINPDELSPEAIEYLKEARVIRE